MKRVVAEQITLRNMPISKQTLALEQHAREADQFAEAAIAADQSFKEAVKHLQLTLEEQAVYEKAYKDLLAQTNKCLKRTVKMINTTMDKIERLGHTSDSDTDSDCAAAGTL